MGDINICLPFIADILIQTGAPLERLRVTRERFETTVAFACFEIVICPTERRFHKLMHALN